jgi:hypothetical protein
MKGKWHKSTINTIQVHLLLATMVMHDSLRLLLTLPLVDEVFGPNITWESLLSVDPGKLFQDAGRVSTFCLLTLMLEYRTLFARNPAVRRLCRHPSFSYFTWAASPQYKTRQSLD